MSEITIEMWKNFEEIVFNIIKSNFDSQTVTNNYIGRLTEARKDGGYDGIFFVENEEYYEYFKLFFEAKLRGNIKKDLPLFDISKAMIIAFNKNAQTLIIATNLHLSTKTREEIKNFSYKSNLSIKYLAPNAINFWVKNNIDTATLKINSNLAELIELSQIENYPYNTIEEISLSNVCDRELEEIIRDEWEYLLEEVENYCTLSTGVIPVEGYAGSGKSFFIDHLTVRLKRKHIFVEKIDLKGIYSPQTLFGKLLSLFWNISIENLLTLSKEDIVEIVQSVSDEKIEQDKIENILFTLRKIDSSQVANPELLQICLIEYLKQVYSLRKTRPKIVISFSNMNYTNTEVLDFLMRFLIEFKKVIASILEIRTSIYIDSFMTSDEWQNYVELFKNLGTYPSRIDIHNFTEKNAFNYIRKYLNYQPINDSVLKTISDKASLNPLLLSSFVQYINITGLHKLPSTSLLCKEIERLPVDDKRQIISSLIKSVCMQNSIFCRFFELLRIFNGQVNKAFAEKVLPRLNDDILELVLKYKICFIRDKIIHIKHVLYLDILKKNIFISISEQQTFAELILHNLQTVSMDEIEKNIIKVEIYRILNSYDKNVVLCYRFAKDFYISGDYKLSYSYANNALMCVLKMDDTTENTFLKIKIYELLVQLSTFIKKDTLSDAQNYLDELKNFFEEDLYFEHHLNELESAEYYNLKCHYYMIKNRNEHCFGDFETSFSTMVEALKCFKQKEKILPTSLITNIMVEYSIALKEKHGIKSSIHALEVFLKKYPNAVDLRFTYNTQNYELNICSNPQKALSYIEKNEDIMSNLGISTQYHNRVHRLNALFCNKKYDLLLTEALNLLEDTTKMNLNNESARIANILGNLFLLKNLNGPVQKRKSFYEKSKQYYDYGIEILKENSYVSNLWPILVNRLTLLLKDNKYEDAIKDIKRLYKILDESYHNSIIDIFFLHKQDSRYSQIKAAIIYLYQLLRDTKWENDTSLVANLYKDKIKRSFLYGCSLESLNNMNVYTDYINSVYIHKGVFLLI